MKKLTLLLVAATLFASCKKETDQVTVDKSINPVLMSISIDSTTTQIIRVR